MIQNNTTPLQGWSNNRDLTQTVILIQGEADGRKITLRLLDGGVPLDLTNAAGGGRPGIHQARSDRGMAALYGG